MPSGSHIYYRLRKWNEQQSGQNLPDQHNKFLLHHDQIKMSWSAIWHFSLEHNGPMSLDTKYRIQDVHSESHNGHFKTVKDMSYLIVNSLVHHLNKHHIFVDTSKTLYCIVNNQNVVLFGNTLCSIMCCRLGCCSNEVSAKQTMFSSKSATASAIVRWVKLSNGGTSINRI